MAKRVFRPYESDQPLPLPADLRQWLPTDHSVYLVSDIVDQLDLSPISSVYDQGDGGGNPPYHPEMLTKRLVYAYSQGVVSSRVIARNTYEDGAFRVLCADQHPDFRTSSAFGERYLQALVPRFNAGGSSGRTPRLGQARARRPGRHEDARQRLEASRDELCPDEAG